MKILFLTLLYLLATVEIVFTAISPNTSNTVIAIPPELTYLLPNGFTGNSNYTFVNGTHTSNDTINELLTNATKAPFISYDEEFANMLGPNPEVKLIAERDNDFAYEMGVWIPERNEVWFTSGVKEGSGDKPPILQALNLDTETINQVNTSEQIVNPNGGYYYRGKVYIATYPDNKTYSAGVVSVDTSTLQVEPVLNSYFGLRFNGIDDLTWASQGQNSYMYFTDLNFAYLVYDNLAPLQMPTNVWRWDPQNQTMLPVINRNEVNPNGVRVSPDMRTLYVTDSTATFAAAAPNSPASGPADAFWLGPYIYAYDLDDRMWPVNRRVFGMVRQGIADGLHVDDAGRVYTGEYEGVVVRNADGKVIGVFNSQFFQADDDVGTWLPIANFALAGDTLVVLSTTRLWTIKLGQTVVSKNSSIVN